ncbi:Calx-beta domain-containing protein [Cylindrospermopsis raciborskii]|uniref:Calx-beta domain-containing protein n=1 Tax=Cylindrospermopsis raciborskii TaxID=77022 RepID=UPI001454D566|nr:DUF4114 domain-containing protein [Cylindrospermopsis raciborskii]NLQ04244.1 DUF4114 domain-containing protein [Cylindrospermopsis raciborskii MVCC19]
MTLDQIFIEVNGEQRSFEISPYGDQLPGDQTNQKGTVKTNANELELSGNLWRKVEINYQITPNTVLEFEFQGVKEGQIHTIGFDNDNVVYDKALPEQTTDDTTFKLWGTEEPNPRHFNPITLNQYNTNDGWKKYTVPLKDHFNVHDLNKKFLYLTFGNDQDNVSPPTANAKFRGIKIHDSKMTDPDPIDPVPPVDPDPGLFEKQLPNTDIYSIKIHDDYIHIAGSTEENLDGQIKRSKKAAFISMYTIEGELKWTQFIELRDENSTNNIKSSTVASDGYIYVASNISSLNNNDIFIVKISTNKELAYPIQVQTNKNEFANAITTGPDNSIYLAGFTEGNLYEQPNTGMSDGFLVKYDSSGKVLWTRLLGTYYDDSINTIATTSEDDFIYVAGYTQGDLDEQKNSGGIDAFIAKYASNGTKIWTKLLGTSRNDSVNSITVGLDNHIYVAGYVGNSIDKQSYNGGNKDAFIAKYTSDGIRLWTKLLGSSNDDSIDAITTGLDGSIYVSGSIGHSSSSLYSNAFVQKYDTNGGLIENQVIGDNNIKPDFARAITIGPKDNQVYVAVLTDGNPFDPGGKVSFVNKIDDSKTSLAISPLDAIKPEGNTGFTTFTFAITRLGNTQKESSVSVDWFIAGDKDDFENKVLPSGKIEFEAGDYTPKEITVKINGDILPEGNEKFTCSIYNPVNAIISTGQADGIIISDDIALSKIKIVNNYAYTISSNGLLVIDISDNNSVSIGGFDTHPQDITVVNNHAYLATIDRIDIVNINDPSNPKLISTVDFPGSYCGIEVINNYIYASTLGSLKIIDITNPFNPKYIQDFYPSDHVWDVKIMGDYGYVASRGSGLQILDITNPSNPKRIGGYDTDGDTVSVEIVGKYAYVADGNAGLQILDITNPANPKRIGGYNTDGNAWDVEVVGDKAYVADRNAGLQILDITNPANPKKIDSYNTDGNAWDVEVVGDKAYVATDIGLKIINLKDDPNNPVIPGLAIAPTNATQTEGNSGTKPFTFTVTRSDSNGISSATWTVTGSGTNQANGGDFGGTLPSGTVNFATGVTSQIITINVSGDTTVEPDEGFTVTLSNPTNATITTATAIGTIQNDDGNVILPVPPVPVNPGNPLFPRDAGSLSGIVDQISFNFLPGYNPTQARQTLQNTLGNTSAAFTNLFGLYEVDSVTGAVNGLTPDKPGYAKAALNRMVPNFVVRAGGSGNGTTGDVIVSGGKIYAPFVIANGGNYSGTIQEAINEFFKVNPNNSPATAQNYTTLPVAYFSFGAANPDGAAHIKSLANNIFGFEDLPSNVGVSDYDFNDMVFSFG